MTDAVEDGESILEALLRGVHEETGLDVTVARFLAASTYLTDGRPQFASFAFPLQETGDTLGALDEGEQAVQFQRFSYRGARLFWCTAIYVTVGRLRARRHRLDTVLMVS